MTNFNWLLIRNSMFYASEEMGIALRNSAYSPNIKERMDHSSAIFDSDGRLIAQAEHIPVHLGSLPYGLKTTLEYLEKENVELKNGDMILVNNPYIAGTHLNDITVIRPIFYKNKIIAYAANKAHHSDIGGKVPGSISIDAESLFEEGLILNPTFLMNRNEFNDDVIKIISSNSRNPYERKGDLRAQAAANFIGERRVIETLEKYGEKDFLESFNNYFEYARNIFLRKLENFKKGEFYGEDFIELNSKKDLKLKVKIRIENKRVIVDYDGTDPQVKKPINAVLGVTISGVYYVFKTILGEDLPVNHGTFSQIEILVPKGSILNPDFPYPVAGGNVETSQRNADLLYLALSKSIPEIVPASSGGSMNNVMIGGTSSEKTWAFYETIGVGTGAKKGKDGIDGIHANMTNTMNTPIEEIEKNFPIIMLKYEFRENSCGMGEFRGGNGIIRSYMARDNLIFTFLSDRFRHSPYGLFGGENGKTTQVIIKKGRNKIYKKENFSIQLSIGDYVEIRTAGGGGYGDKIKRDRKKLIEDFENGMIKRNKIDFE
ncbi:MAG: hydantoinase B/oxoprolinase family protein [Thermoplasmata archaeon]